MKECRCVLVLPTNSSYLDVTENFLELLRINWPDCPYEVVVSITGEDIKISGYNCIYNGDDATLPDCVKAVAKEIPAKLYLCMLGDAFICSKWNNEIFESILDEMITHKIQYCSLKKTRLYYKEKDYNKYLRYINHNDRYGFTFISFIADKKFIDTEFRHRTSDFDFENQYLRIANKKDGKYYRYGISVKENYFDIHPGIIKGKWERGVYRLIKGKYNRLNLAERELLSIPLDMYYRFSDYIAPVLPVSVRENIKKTLNKVCKVDITET